MTIEISNCGECGEFPAQCISYGSNKIYFRHLNGSGSASEPLTENPERQRFEYTLEHSYTVSFDEVGGCSRGAWQAIQKGIEGERNRAALDRINQQEHRT